MEPVAERMYRGYTIRIYYDDYPDADPRQWDNLGTMVCFHSRYQLGDPHDYSPEEVIKMLNSGNYIWLPLYLFDHGGVTIATNDERFRMWDPAGWDWGQCGFIFVSKDKIRERLGVKRITRRVREKVLAILEAEVKEYNAYLQGKVYGYKIVSPHGKVVDSCWGFVGDFVGDWEESGLLDYAKGEIDADLRSRPLLFEEVFA